VHAHDLVVVCVSVWLYLRGHAIGLCLAFAMAIIVCMHAYMHVYVMNVC